MSTSSQNLPVHHAGPSHIILKGFSLPGHRALIQKVGPRGNPESSVATRDEDSNVGVRAPPGPKGFYSQLFQPRADKHGGSKAPPLLGDIPDFTDTLTFKKQRLQPKAHSSALSWE